MGRTVCVAGGSTVQISNTSTAGGVITVNLASYTIAVIGAGSAVVFST